MGKMLEWINKADNTLREVKGEKEENIKYWNEIWKENGFKEGKLQILKIGK